MKIIVVEDEIRIREGICKLIKKFFPEHDIAGSVENGKEGYELALRERPDLIITDVKMPVMDGLEMLANIYSDRLKCSAIVLSAYAEFKYAQQAMRWGVSEYLIKPLVVNELVQAVKNVELKQEEDKKLNPEVLGQLDHIFFGVIFGGMPADDKLADFLENKYNLQPHSSLIQIQIYLGASYDTYAASKREEIERLLKQKENLLFCALELPKEKKILVIIYQYTSEKEIERWLQFQISSASNDPVRMKCNYGWIVASGIANLKHSYQTLTQHMDWNISFGDNILISYPKILQVQTSVCIYPVDIEKQVKAAVCAYDLPKTLTYIKYFKDHFGNGQIYHPREIKDVFVRFLWAFINIAKELGIMDAGINQQQMLKKIMEAVNRDELWDVVDEAVGYVDISGNGQDDGALTYNVIRAEKMIMEHYRTGITLDEIASRLNITPEYLSLQFHKEKGVNFSSYIKNFRINKAKELLIGSEMKIFEIAQRVGYTDPKYFSRVFKECTGQLPAEYRKAYK